MTDDLMALADALHDSGTAVPVPTPVIAEKLRRSARAVVGGAAVVTGEPTAQAADSEGRTGGVGRAPGAVPFTLPRAKPLPVFPPDGPFPGSPPTPPPDPGPQAGDGPPRPGHPGPPPPPRPGPPPPRLIP